MEQIKFGFTAQQIIAEGRVSRADIDLLKSWLSTQNFPKLTDEQIVMFLLSCQNNQEDTKATIKAYYAVKKSAPAVFDNWRMDSPDVQKALTAGEACVLPERTDEGCAVIMYRFRENGYSNWEFAHYLLLIFMTLDAAIYDYPPTGLIILVDMKEMSLMHLTRLRPGLMKTCFQYLQEALPVRLHAIEVLNSSSFVDKVLTLVRPFAKKEVLEQMRFHPKDVDMEWFYRNWLAKKCVPKEYGGEQPAVEVLHDRNVEKLTQLQPHFEAEEMQRRSILS